jgi:uncharacterized repeat protein (TIGR04076 family)
MPRCKITVIKKMINPELADAYCQTAVTSCPCFKEGQEFTAKFEKPAGFCDWAWNDIFRFVTVLLSGGNFSSGIFNGWMKDEKTMIASCSDGVRPVVFLLEKIED